MGQSKTREELVAELAARAGISKEQCRAVLDGLARTALNEAENGFTIPGLCRLSVQEHAPHTDESNGPGPRRVLRIEPLPEANEAVDRAPQRQEPPPAPPPQAPSPEPIFITFRCSQCGAEIEASTDMAQTIATCPGCTARITVPSTSSVTAFAQIEDIPESSSPDQPDGGEDWKKGSTIRIELPKSYKIPRAVRRTVYIKRRK